MGRVLNLSAYRKQPRTVFFDRTDLNRLLSLYSRHVTKGEWKDYAMSNGEGMATFSVFRRSADRPVYTVIKYAARDNGDPEYVVYNGARRLRRGSSLSDVLDLFESRLTVV